MDGNDFDNMVRKLGGMASRRAAVAGMLAGAFGATRIGQTAAKRKGRGKDVGTAACNDQGCLAGPFCISGFGTDTACGSGGTICAPCGGATPRCAPNTEFTGGSCQAAIACNSGQCQLAGACVSLTDPRVCGRAANGTCLQGCASGQVCNLGTVGAFPTAVTGTCVTNTCTATCQEGCCAGLSCNAGTSVGSCGDNGATCINCIDHCGLTNNGCAADPADGVRKCQCDFAPTPPPVEDCGPANCPNGCCREVSVGVFTCVAGNEKTACGTGGQTCQACGRKQKCNGTTKVCKRRNKK